MFSLTCQVLRAGKKESMRKRTNTTNPPGKKVKKKKKKKKKKKTCGDIKDKQKRKKKTPPHQHKPLDHVGLESNTDVPQNNHRKPTT
jgi:hypothetical protein